MERLRLRVHFLNRVQRLVVLFGFRQKVGLRLIDLLVQGCKLSGFIHFKLIQLRFGVLFIHQKIGVSGNGKNQQDGQNNGNDFLHEMTSR